MTTVFKTNINFTSTWLTAGSSRPAALISSRCLTLLYQKVIILATVSVGKSHKGSQMDGRRTSLKPLHCEFFLLSWHQAKLSTWYAWLGFLEAGCGLGTNPGSLYSQTFRIVSKRLSTNTRTQLHCFQRDIDSSLRIVFGGYFASCTRSLKVNFAEHDRVNDSTH